jgi:hypothetical protein
MTNDRTLPEAAPTTTVGDALAFAVPEFTVSISTPLDRTAVQLRSRTRVRPALKGSTSD